MKSSPLVITTKKATNHSQLAAPPCQLYQAATAANIR
jgi:hypothetical protein